MKQFIVFIHSKFSKASVQCESIINTLPSELNINYLSIDNPKTRKVILQDSQLEIKIVPTILVVDIKGKVSKFEGKTCFEYLSQFQPPPPPAPKQSFLQEEVIVKPTPPPPTPQQPTKSQQKPPQQQQQKPKKPLVPINEPINFDEELFNSQPTNNITSLDDDDDEMSEDNDDRQKSTPIPPPLPLQRPPSPQQQQQKNVKPNILAHAQAMQKSRLQDDDFNKKNH